MSAMDNTAAAAFLKTRFTKKAVQDLAYSRHPLLAMISKDTTFGGDSKKIPLKYAGIKGASASFSAAKALKSPSDSVAFLLTTVEDYALFSIKGKTMLQSRGNENAFYTALESETESAMQVASKRCAMNLYRKSTGTIGQLSASTGLTTETVYLAYRGQTLNFYKGMQVGVTATDGGPLLGSPSYMEIASVDRDLGTITGTAHWDDTIASIAVSYFLVPRGDLNIRMSGLLDWVPATAPGATSYYGVNRSYDVTALGGHRITDTGLTLEEKLRRAMARVGESGGKISHFFIPYDKWEELGSLLGSRKEYCKNYAVGSDGKPIADIGFEGYRVYGPDGSAEVYADPDCTSEYGWGLQLDTWTLESTGEVPQILGLDNNSILRESDDDAYEGRVGYYANVSCNAPGYNAIISL